MRSVYWPIFDLRLTAGELELRPMTEDDLGPMADLLPDDLELDPAATTYAALDQPIWRGVVLHQEYWRSLGTWRVESWRLGFAVRRRGELIGFQELEGNDFPMLRTVDTSSWLVESARGRGHGKQMRAAVLSLAFGPLGAEAAITSAWHDNDASLGVSRALGYRPNGESAHARGDRTDRMVHLRLSRSTWDASPHAGAVTVEGFKPCRPLFGLSPRDA